MIYIIPTDTCFWIACSISDKKNYEKIYKIKKREYSKPLTIIIENFNWLEQNTDLTKEQIKFLKNYKKPFTILTNSDYVKIWLNYEDEEGGFINKDVYKQIAFRVANNNIQKKLIKENWPMFLTSANLSGKVEIYTLKELKEEFKYYLDKKIIELRWDNNLNKNIPSSDIFEFVWESLDIEYLRKN